MAHRGLQKKSESQIPRSMPAIDVISSKNFGEVLILSVLSEQS